MYLASTSDRYLVCFVICPDGCYDCDCPILPSGDTFVLGNWQIDTHALPND
jgi:hypothetical protein